MEDGEAEDIRGGNRQTHEDVTSSLPAVSLIGDLSTDQTAISTAGNATQTQSSSTFQTYSWPSNAGISASGNFTPNPVFSSQHYGRYETEGDDLRMSTRRRPQLTSKGREYQVDL